ncbi:MAG: hypothetical protein AAF572_01425 [Cyanobacteria bacterium P01_B01_bin.77]
MNDCCNISNPLRRDGVSQRQRQLAALSPDYIRVDERSLADFLAFTHGLAQQVNYYDLDDQLAGNWQSLFAHSTPVQIALISKTRPQILNQSYQQQLDVFLENQSSESLEPILLTWANGLRQLQQWYQTLQPYTPLKSIIQGLVKTNLGEPLNQMRGIEAAYEIDAGQLANPSDFYENFATVFGLTLGDLNSNDIPLTGTRFQARSLLDAIFQILFQNYRQIIQLAPQYLVSSLSVRADHPPHLALYITFLEVMKPVQADLNRMTQRHLDFFYQQVLQLPRRDAQPDHVHLLLELAKSQQDYGLKADIRFKAGKDATNMELFYRLARDVVLDKAQVVSLKGLFLNARSSGTHSPLITGLYGSAIANSADGRGADFAKDLAVKAWLPFGDTSRERARLGLAIASPILLLSEGQRIVTFEFTLTNLKSGAQVPPNQLSDLFKVSFSGEKEWIVANVLASSSQNNNTLILIVDIAVDAGAVVPYHGDLPGATLPTTQPVVRIELQDEGAQRQTTGTSADTFVSAYHYFQESQFTQVKITTDVKELRTLVLQNDLSVLDATKPFQPFGPRPKAGSNFYIGSQEVFQKALTALKVHIDFETVVSDWDNYYAGYGASPDPGNVTVQALRSKTWQPNAPASPVQKNLFVASPISLTTESLDRLALDHPEATNPVAVWTHQSKNGFLRLQLTNDDDFLHDDYTKVLSRQVLAQAMAAGDPPRALPGAYYWVDGKARKSNTNQFSRSNISGAISQSNISQSNIGEASTASIAASISGSTIESIQQNLIANNINAADINTVLGLLADNFSDFAPNIPPGSEVIVPNEPFTPVVQSLYLDYVATATQQDCQFFTLTPFDGFAAIDIQTSPYFVPYFHQAGELLIGLANLQPQSTLNLLIQVAEETADTDLKTTEIHWHYLKDNTWKPLEDYQIIGDSSNGLIGSGIVQLAIPADISREQTTILDSTLYWLKVSTPERVGAVPNMIGIYAQAIQVTFIDQNNDPNHLAAPLPANTIAKLVMPQPAIKKIQQPYDSFGGRPKERSQAYYTRISEKLRHKGRAITIFDYERLVLEHFPEIYKVRCINHGGLSESNTLQELVPGSVTLAVIPDLSQRQTTDSLTPRVNINLLEKIKDTLSQLCPSWVDLHVVNPLYEAIQVDFQVRFKEPYEANFAYYSRELNQAIVGFLSPWTAQSEVEINFGGKVYRSSILNFVEEHPYVDHVINFKMHQGQQRNLREFTASTARSILVSVPFQADTAQGHVIQAITTYPQPTQPIT